MTQEGQLGVINWLRFGEHTTYVGPKRRGAYVQSCAYLVIP